MSLVPARAGSTVTSSVAPSAELGSSPRAPGSAATVVVNGPGAVAGAGGWWTSAAVNASTAPATAVSARSDRVRGATVGRRGARGATGSPTRPRRGRGSRRPWRGAPAQTPGGLRQARRPMSSLCGVRAAAVESTGRSWIGGQGTGGTGGGAPPDPEIFALELLTTALRGWWTPSTPRSDPSARPVGPAAERQQQLVLRVVGRDAARALGDDPGTAEEVLAVLEPGGYGVDQLGVEAPVAAGRGRQVPSVDEVVGGKLVGVLLGGRVAEREGHGASGDQAACGRDGGW